MDTELLIKQRIEALSDVDFSLPSGVEVIMDELASLLMDRFAIRSKALAWKTPSLFEVAEILVSGGHLSDQILDLLIQIEYLFKQAYGERLNGDDAADMEDSICRLRRVLLEELRDE